MEFSKLKETNAYIIVYASVLVIIVAFLLAFISSVLRPVQDANVLRDTKNQILMSLNIVGLKDAAIDQTYDQVIEDTLFVGDNAMVFQANVDGSVKYVMPVKGRGLWGGLWGYISVNQDKKNVFGTYFSHESETAGLGARIADRDFQERFNGRPVFGDDASQVALTVTKDGAAKLDTEVNGITGATLTSVGVAAMVNEGLQSYIQFLNDGAEAAPVVGMKKCCKNCKQEGQNCGEECPMDGSCCDECTSGAACEHECADGECSCNESCGGNHCGKCNNE